jgi:hypothetical protein
MTQACTWVQVGRRQLANGRWVESTPTTLNGYCRVGKLGNSGVEKEIAGRLSGKVLYTLTIPYDWTAMPSDRLTVGTRVFEVAGVIASGFITARRAVCSEVI